jgi:glutamyl-tRNA synthetase
MDELVQLFSLERVTKSGSKFDPKKAEWFNHQYMIAKSNAEIATLYMPFLKQKGLEPNMELLEIIMGMVKERANFIKDLWEQSHFFFETPVTYDAEVVKKRWKDDTAEQMLSIKNTIANVNEFNGINAKHDVSELIEKNQWGFGAIMNALRLCIVGAAKGPDLFEIIEIIGQSETVKRIDKAVAVIKR